MSVMKERKLQLLAMVHSDIIATSCSYFYQGIGFSFIVAGVQTTRWCWVKVGNSNTDRNLYKTLIIFQPLGRKNGNFNGPCAPWLKGWFPVPIRKVGSGLNYVNAPFFFSEVTKQKC